MMAPMGASYQLDPMNPPDPTGAGMALLLQGVQNLGLAIAQIKHLQSALGKLEVEYVLQNDAGVQIGVRHDKDKRLELVLADPKDKKALEMMEKVRQAYARCRVLDELGRKGYKKVKEEKLADGSVRLVVEKWQ